MMQQAAVGEGLSFDPFALKEDRLTATEVDVSRGEIAQALMSAGVVVVLEQDAVLEREVPALDLALRLRVAGRAGCL